MEITLSTTVNSLLTEYPQLEQVLSDLDPKFEKLRNPILRKSIGRVATLEQAAAIANISPVELINQLRRAVDQLSLDNSDGNSHNV